MHRHIPIGIKKITLARSIRWFGWGLCETLIPVVILSFSRTYVEAGVFRSIYDIVFLLSLPTISALADRIPAKKLILFALVLYPLIGISYFAAGVFGAAVFVVIARAINGVTWCCDSVGGDTYLRRFALDGHITKSFGYLSAFPNISWMLAALISIMLIPIVPIHWLFLGIVPTSIIAYLVLRRAPTDDVVRENISKKWNFIEMFKDIRLWKGEIWALAGLTFFIACLDVLGTFFLPLFAFSETQDMTKVVLVTVAFAIPSAFAFWLGSIIDKVSKVRCVVFSIGIVAVLLVGLALSSGFMFQIIGIFFIGVFELCATLALAALVTEASTKDQYGKVGGVMAGAEEVGAIAGPIAVGLLADMAGMRSVYIVLAVVSVFVALAMMRFSRGQSRHA